MTRLPPVTAVALVLILAACAGPAPSAQPTIQPTTVSTNQPTMAATHPPTVEPTPISPPTASPAESFAEPSFPPSQPPSPAWWRELTAVAPGPSAREDHTWTVNGDGTIAYLFGGRGTGGASNELWAFDLATNSWSQLTQTVDTPIPAARFGHTATWVPDVGLVVWSGQGNSGFFDDIWTWDTARNMWLELPPLGAVPAARYGSCASLGPDGELWISHGFTEDSGRFSDTRSYDFASGSWTDRTPLDRVPVERCLHDCFWSSESGRLILYGGQTTGVAALGDLWAYDPASGAWTPGGDPAAPARQLYSLVSTDRGAVVFGGGSLDGGFLDDAWMIDPVTLELSPLAVASPPPPRAGATLAFDLVQQRLLLFGGKDADGVRSDIWELSPTP